MKKGIKASVLGIGTELTSGQIVNGNASWISARLKSQGQITSMHLAVPDEKKLILQALDFCAEHSDLIFVTGGLGPTSDDLTRDLIATWLNKEMQYDAGTWEHIVERLKSRGISVGQLQKQQCYFPKGSRILTNSMGTAHGFFIHERNKDIFVLPGPPREIEAIWKDHIQVWLKEQTEGMDPYQTLSWDVLGRSEGEVAQLSEGIVGQSGLEIGYRVHLPYVEVKLSFYESQRKEKENYFQALDKALSQWTVLRQGQDAAMLFAESLLREKSVLIADEISNGYLWQRLQASFRQKDLWKNYQVDFTNKVIALPEYKTSVFQIKKIDSSRAEVSWQCVDARESEILSNPYSSSPMDERRNQFFIEKALLFWSSR